MGLVHEWKEGLHAAWDALSDGVAKLRERALTHFSADTHDAVPRSAEGRRLPVASWAYLAVDVYEEGDRIMVRVEAPGMEKEDFSYAMHGNLLTVSGAKRFTTRRDVSQYRVLECAYGSFQRMVPLPVPVKHECTDVRYENGVLYIEVPKLDDFKVQQVSVNQG